MAFSGSSYFAGIGTAFAAIAFGFACGTMVTTSAIQPPNRLERLNGGAGDPSKPGATSASATAPSVEPSSREKPPAQNAPPSATAAAPAAATADPQPQPAAPAAVKAGSTTRAQEQSPAATAAADPAPQPAARSEDAAPAKTDRPADANRDASRKKADTRKSSDDRKFSERRRRHDQDERRLDEATNVTRQMPRERTIDENVSRDDGPRFGIRPRHFDPFGGDQPRIVDEPPPRFGFFGD